MNLNRYRIFGSNNCRHRDYRVDRMINETISLFVDNHICGVIQLMCPTSLPICTDNHLANRRTTSQFHNTVIRPICDIYSLFLISIRIVWEEKLMYSTPVSIFSSPSETILYPSGIQINISQTRQ
jgi:hypothetical protein